MEITEKEFTKLQGVLSEFKELDPIPEYMPTIFEIAGYPHYEDVMSNVLQFFFSADYDHGFSSIFVEALLNTVGLNPDGFESSELLVQEVEREYLTNQGNRIDLVIETESHCIAIEHKIYASLYNDLQEYQDSIKSRSDKENIYIVLAKGRKVIPNDEGHDFNLITYKQFFEELERQIGKGVSSADSRILMYIGDFIKTIKNLSKKTHMSDEFISFLSKNREQVESLYQYAFKDFKKEVKHKAERIDELIEFKNSEFQRSRFNPQDQLKYVLVYKKFLEWGESGLTIQVKLRIIPNNYMLEIWAPNSSEEQLFQNLIEEKLGKNNFSNWKTHKASKNGSIVYKEFEYGEDPEDVATEIENLIKKIT